MILQRYGYTTPTQQELTARWCAAGEADARALLLLTSPLTFAARLTYLRDDEHNELMEWLARGQRWIISLVGCYGLACIACAHTPPWTSRHGALATLAQDDEDNPRSAIKRYNLLTPRHAVVLCGYDPGARRVALLDPFHDSAPRPVWIEEDDLDKISIGNYYYPTTNIP
jgi:hypothetical protein